MRPLPICGLVALFVILPCVVWAQEASLFADNFAGGTSSAWTLQPPIDALGKIPPNGTWAVEPGALVATGTAVPWTLQTAGDPAWTDYKFSVKVTIRKPTPPMQYPIQDCEYDRYLPHGKEAPIRCEHSGQCRYRYYAGEFDWGSDAAVYVRYQDRNQCYRVQLSTEYQEMILWHGVGGYLQVVPCKLTPGRTYQLEVLAQGEHLQVYLDGKKTIDYWHDCLPSLHGGIGLAAYQSTVAFQDAQVTAVPAAIQPVPLHQEKFTTRTWRDQRWVFDGNEPIVLLEKEASGNDSAYNAKAMHFFFVKLRPGYRPLFFGHVSVFPSYPWVHMPQLIGDEWTGIQTSGEGSNRLTLDFDAITPEQSLKTHHTDIITYDRVRGTYRHDLTMHATFLTEAKNVNGIELLDPLTYNNHAPGRGVKYGWLTEGEWCVMTGQDGKLIRHPLAESMSLDGQDSWMGPSDHSQEMLYPERAVCPAWETTTSGEPVRYQMCLWGYDFHAGICYDKPRTFQPNDTVTAKISILGYPPEEAERRFLRSEIAPNNLHPEEPGKRNNVGVVPSAYAMPVCDPAGTDFATVHDTSSFFVGWPFTGDYTLDNTVGHNDHYSLRMDGPSSVDGVMYHHMLDLYAPTYLCTTWVKTKGVRGGKGVIIRLKYNYAATPCDTLETGITGDTDWQEISWITTVPCTHDSTELTFRLDGVGTAWIDDFSLRPIEAGETPVEHRGTPLAALPTPSADYLVDLPCNEGAGVSLLDTSNHGHSAKLDGATWITSGRRPVLHFANGTAAFITSLSPALRMKEGDPRDYPGAALTIDAWIRPTAGKQGGAIIGYMASPMLFLQPAGKDLFTLNLMVTPLGQKGVTLTSDPLVPPGQWTHVAAIIDASHTARLYVNGKPAGEKALGGNFAYGAYYPLLSIGTFGKYYGYQYSGDLADLRWWSRAATDAELAAAAATAPDRQ